MKRCSACNNQLPNVSYFINGKWYCSIKCLKNKINIKILLEYESNE